MAKRAPQGGYYAPPAYTASPTSSTEPAAMPDSDICPVSLTDIQMAAAHPLPPDRRSAFLAEVARTLASERVIGDGLLHRVITHVQRQYFDPPLLTRARHSPQYPRSASTPSP